MLLNEINLSLDKINELFLQHRDGVDPENYRVGKINDKIIIYNPDTQKFMEYFYDDRSDLEWFNLEFIDTSFKSYEVNRNGDIRNKKSHYILSNTINETGYPRVSMSINNKNKRLFTHIAIGKIFIPNIDPKEYKIVDHINRNRGDYSLHNLRWSTLSENSKNSNRKLNLTDYRYVAFYDKERTKIYKEYSLSEMIDKFGNEKRRSIQKVGKKKLPGKANGLYWRLIDTEAENYLINLGINPNRIDDSKWVLHYSGKYQVHPLGLVRSLTEEFSGIYHCGYPNGRYLYSFKEKKGGKGVHIIVAEVFLNNNKPIAKELVVDHLNTNSFDNRVENLKICTHSENMKNSLTRENCGGIKVIDPKGNIYISLKECAEAYKVTRWTITTWIKKFPEKGFRYYNP